MSSPMLYAPSVLACSLNGTKGIPIFKPEEITMFQCSMKWLSLAMNVIAV